MFLSNIHFSQNLTRTNQHNLLSEQFIGTEKSKILAYRTSKIHRFITMFWAFHSEIHWSETDTLIYTSKQNLNRWIG